MKKAILFTIDSLLASGIIIVAILLVSTFYISEQQQTNINYASQDIVRVFSTLAVGQADNNYVKSLISSGEITNINNTIIEQIGEFWAEGKLELARNFTKNITNDVLQGFGVSVLVNGEEIYTNNLPIKAALVSYRKIISGIAKAKPTQGFTARVLLSGIKSKKTNAYAYFGGYEGDGNITKKLILPKDVISFNSSYLEVDAGGNFDLYINNVFSGSYTKGSSAGNMLADKWNISNAYIPNFRAGENIIQINFTSGNSYIAGGFLRVTYVTSSYNDTQTIGYEKYLFPGIDGVINLYSSIYIPGSLNNMVIFLNHSGNYTIFLKLGNTTVYEGNPNGTANATLTNSTLNALLSYASLTQKTIPLRLGIVNSTNIDNQLIDLSGLARTVLHSGSFIEFNYSIPEIKFNKVPLAFETERFGNNISSGTLTVYANTSVLDARVTSYSGTKWTDKLIVNGNTVYRLSDYGSNYQILGDPFAVNIPIGNINTGSNSITISTGINSSFSTSGSNDSRVIYTLLLNGFADYSSVVAKSDGCSWTVSFEDGTGITMKIPSNYNGADACNFLSKTYDANDALDNAVYQLFSNLDTDKDGKLDVNVAENNIDVSTLTISKVPSLWGPAIIEIRVWR